ncbi:NAD(P)/FAD-dependent oxidoreductase [Cyanobacterium aponinum UTEX 3222]|uniref:NAD(P)/FAD-dependent oxidoreductase n=1 Tax=Cyanobacterium aponinum TaxID=379064 RepID=UPI003084972C|nr:NAD(P)/FAD-dependent oxidoreductase [Cyanobacterium aponinum UTEX 3222]
MKEYKTIIIGAGVAGLGCGYELANSGHKPLILEKGSLIGGLAQTPQYKGYRFDIGGHRFYTKIPEIQQLWERILGESLTTVQRLSRIYYYHQYFSYPISAPEVIQKLGLVEALRILGSYLKSKVNPPQIESLEDYIIANFGERLYQLFFKGYTQKVWGRACSEISAEWGQQRIKGLSLGEVISKALGFKSNAKSLIEEFYYPKLGCGQMYEVMGEKIVSMGGEIKLGVEVEHIYIEDNRVVGVLADGLPIECDHLVSSMPLSTLLQVMDGTPQQVIESAQQLQYRDFLVVCLILNKPDIFPDNWIYVHNDNVAVGRIQNYRNWSTSMIPDDNTTCLGMEYFCDRDSGLWNTEDKALVYIASIELQSLGLANYSDVIDGFVFRQPLAYPVYGNNYQHHIQVIRQYLNMIPNLQTIGRNGLHRYNNMDHSMLTGLISARNILGRDGGDVWEVNTERSYYETFEK